MFYTIDYREAKNVKFKAQMIWSGTNTIKIILA